MSEHDTKVKANHLDIEESCMKDYEDLSEQDLRIQLAASYRLVEELGWSYLIFGHLTARVPGPNKHFLINPYGLMYDEVTASNLLEIDLNGNILSGDGEINYTGFVIHGAIHKARKDLSCVMHSHSRSGLAVSCLIDGLEILIQDSAMFHNRVSYHDWKGISTSTKECESIAKDLDINNTMILRNHGLLTSGKTIAEAFMLMYYLDRACKNQIDILSMGNKITIPSDKIMEFTARQYQEPRFHLGKHEWPALLRLLDKNKSIYKD